MPDASALIRAIVEGRLRAPGAGSDRLEFLATIDDDVWELVGGGPQGLRTSRLSQVGLNPQPLPPHDAGQVLLNVMARGIIVVGGRDEGAVHAFLEDIDDWCGTGWPRRWPRPKPGPGPDPREEIDPSAFLGGAFAAAELAASYPAGEVQDLFARAADQLMNAALPG